MKCYALLLLPFLVSANNMAFPPLPDEPKLLLLSDQAVFNKMKYEYAVLNFVGLVRKHGYPAEEHNVTTEDGYRITIFRIPGSRKSPKSKGKPVVFIQHGITCSSDMWVLMGPNKDLAFLAADAGYDVWVGNVRGNSYGRSHAYLSPDHNIQFWKYSYHEIALYDLPAMIDYVLETTGQKSLSYIGHSQGTTISYVLLSTKPEYNKKFRINISLSSVTFWLNRAPGLLDLFIKITEPVKNMLIKNKFYELLPQSPLNIFLAERICKTSSFWQSICAAVYFQISGVNVPQLNPKLIPRILKYGPAGTSLQSFHHYIQNIRNPGTFRAYDYGSKVKNMKKYNRKTPPSYNLKNVVAPCVLFYGRGDNVSSEKEAQFLAKRLPNVVSMEAVPDQNFGHLDFLFATNIKPLLNDRILKILSKSKYDNNIPVNDIKTVSQRETQLTLVYKNPVFSSRNLVFFQNV